MQNERLPMTRFALTLEFDGGPFMGLQRQPHGPTVQQAVEEAILAITGEQAAMHAAGRTDAGVHALAMRAHVDVAKEIAPFRLMEALNARLRPAPIAVIACEIVPDDWHARFSCIGRSYQYRVVNRRAPLTLEAGRAWHVRHPLDAEAMHRAAQTLVGHHDFTTFRSVHCQSKSASKSLDRLAVRREGELLLVEAEARGHSCTIRCARWSAAWCWSDWGAGARGRLPRRWQRGTGQRWGSMHRRRGCILSGRGIDPPRNGEGDHPQDGGEAPP